MFFLSCLTLLVLLLLIISICKLNHTNQKLKTIQTKSDRLYHDINSSLVIFKLTLESLKDFSFENQENDPISLIEALEESIGYMEESFRHWNFK
ncbi:hypothetical protein [Legionella sp.]|uniref:hypothetical protein n=1 Tax=Legionella sp. TaxID=459 RepID=UPI003CC591B7